MKKILLSIGVALYMIVSTGMVIRVNFCMGKTAGLSVLPVDKTPCSTCGMHKPGSFSRSCCSSETKFFKLDDDQKQLETAYAGIQLVSGGILPPFLSFPSPDLRSAIGESYFSHAPPRSPQVAIYLLHRSFLI